MGYIYKITNLINQKMYIGQTIRSIEVRWKEHLRSKDNAPIHKAIQKYGQENFIIEEIEECEDSLLNEREQYYIKFFNSYNGHIGYNATEGGNSNPNAAINWIKGHPQQVKENLDLARKKAIQKFKDNPSLQEKREKARLEGCQRYRENHKEEWLEHQRKALKKAQEALKKEYQENPEKIIKRAIENGKKASKPVKQLDKKTKEVIQIFESCSEAARSCGKEGGYSNISRACKTGGTAYGYCWVYAN